jgi:hypothetical protein
MKFIVNRAWVVVASVVPAASIIRVVALLARTAWFIHFLAATTSIIDFFPCTVVPLICIVYIGNKRIMTRRCNGWQDCRSVGSVLTVRPGWRRGLSMTCAAVAFTGIALMSRAFAFATFGASR